MILQCRVGRNTVTNHSLRALETPDLVAACWFMVSRRALAPVDACGEATKPGLAPASAQRLTKSAV
jgi:hypothetical protein